MDTQAKILIVEGDMSSAEMLWTELLRAGYQPLIAFSIERAALLIAKERPQVILVRQKLPDASALSLINCMRTHRATSRLPVIVLGEEGADEEECVRALERGADDYVRRPYGVRELLARIQVLLRPIEYRGKHDSVSHETASERHRVSVETLSMDFDAHRAFARTGPNPGDEVELQLVPTSYRFLRLLVENPYKVLSRKDIINNVWFGKSLSEGIIEVYVNQLREALKPLANSLRIETVRGVGYRLTKVTAPAPADAQADATGDAVRAHVTSPAQTLNGGKAAHHRHPPNLVSNMDAAIEKIRQLHLLLQRKTEENELLRDSIEAGKQASSEGIVSVPPKKRR